MTTAVNRLHWDPSWRLVPSRFPPTELFDRVANAGDLDIIIAIEGLTNDRLREEAGEISLVPDEDRIWGPGTTPIMASFTHLNPEGSRFTDGSYGVYYAAKTIQTAVAETKYHRARFLAATKEPAIEVDMRSYASVINEDFHDICGQQAICPDIYAPEPENYGYAQAFAKKLRGEGSNGIVYDSVRDPDGKCVAVFRPRLLSPVTQGAHYCYGWDGSTITHVYIKEEFN